MWLADNAHEFVGMPPDVPKVVVSVGNPDPVKPLLQVLIYHTVTGGSAAADSAHVEKLADDPAWIPVVRDPPICIRRMVKNIESSLTH